VLAPVRPSLPARHPVEVATAATAAEEARAAKPPAERPFRGAMIAARPAAQCVELFDVLT
jgi:hypothetical protein